MFTIKKYKKNNPFEDYIHIYSKDMSCKIYPNIGATIQSLIVKDTDILYGKDDLPKPLDFFTVNPSILMFPFPGRIKNGNYFYKNNQFQLEQNEQNRDNAIHGLVAHKPFTLINSESNNNQANLSFLYSVKNADEGFPYDFDFTVHYKIKNDQIDLNFEILNTGSKKFPFALGWHPYFKSTDLSNDKISFKTSKEVLCDENMIPVGKKSIEEFNNFKIGNTHFDTCYILNDNNINLKTQQYSAKLSIQSKNQQYLQLFTPNSRNCIAIEPMNCIPDAFNNGEGLSQLSPGCIFLYKINLTIEIND